MEASHRLFVLEGIDGCGKNTVAELLARRFGGKVLGFPAADTVTGFAIRQYLAGIEHEAHGPLAFQALQLVNRIEYFDTLANPPVPLVLVRYWQSGVVYGSMDGLDREFLIRIHEVLPQAHFNVLLDLPVTEADSRLAGRTTKEIYEVPEKMQRAATLYRELWAEHNHTWPVIDATQSVDLIVDQLTALWATVLPRQ